MANNIVIYDYQPSRAGGCPKAFLGGYTGYLQVDSYAAYASTNATLAGCMAHARRKFIDLQISDKTPEEKYALRQLHSLPLPTEFKYGLIKRRNKPTLNPQ